MHRYRWITAGAALLSLLGASGAAAQGITFVAFLTNDQETSPVVPTLVTGEPRPISFGLATFALNADHSALSFMAVIHNIDFTGMQTADPNDNLAAAHIHAAPTVTPMSDGPVVWGFFGMPFNDTDPTDVVVTPFATGVGGTVSGTWNLAEGNNTTLPEQLPNVVGEHSYINFHTVQFPRGEIRGAILVTPEPVTLLLVGGGLLTLGAAARRRRAA
ncbi:MAG TPA: CHRD domain-containing protein [Gemmatimonadaceae bacterium]|nr:CHRD domain-containing protein [Gemmatimonadaceae bacterium]